MHEKSSPGDATGSAPLPPFAWAYHSTFATATVAPPQKRSERRRRHEGRIWWRVRRKASGRGWKRSGSDGGAFSVRHQNARTPGGGRPALGDGGGPGIDRITGDGPAPTVH